MNIYANNKVVSDADPLPIKMTGGSIGGASELYILEQRTHADLVGGNITLSQPATTPIEIYNTDPTNDGVFRINGMGLNVPAGSPPFMARVRGTPLNVIQVSGSTSFVITVYEGES
ncbi:hypothetical protein [Paenibacillus oceani]|uniref:Uncharacterized protein n=1 Tax=Paenibacillus oceani TaxID=2772510 RepID=A0A927C7K9_9BACL|nr:hypothetical protein [Paenibacillus oceani]MBD2861608.1 hypothetical protein [Paenibacillus oceani]